MNGMEWRIKERRVHYWHGDPSLARSALCVCIYILTRSRDSTTPAQHSTAPTHETMIHIPNLQIPDWDTNQYYKAIGGRAFFSNHFICNDDQEFVDYSFSSDQFRMFDFKVKICQRGRSHDWTECPYAHHGEKARRRDPNKYSGTPCPEFRKGNCNRGESCQFAHGVFECWLHPSRYRTQLCKDGTACRRRVCFFAHTLDQLRLSTPESFVSSPTSVLINPNSPAGKGNSRYGALSARRGLVESMGNAQLEDSTRGSRIGSPLGGYFRMTTSEGNVIERVVESGILDVRAKMYTKENYNVDDAACLSPPVPDIGWVSELLK